MDVDIYQKVIEHTLLAKYVSEALIHRVVEALSLSFDIDGVGVDPHLHCQNGILCLTLTLADVEYVVIVECKSFASQLTLDEVRSFFDVIHDVKNARGIMVTKIGYSSEADEFAKSHGLELKHLVKPTDDDWTKRVKKIHANSTMTSVISTKNKPLNAILIANPDSRTFSSNIANLFLRVSRYEELLTIQVKDWLIQRFHKGFLPMNNIGYYNKNEPFDEGPLLCINEGLSDEEFVQINELQVSYFVEPISEEMISDGEQVEGVIREYVEKLVFEYEAGRGL